MTLLKQLMVWFAILVIALLPVFITLKGDQAEVRASDSSLAPFLAAMSASDRSQLGFSDLPKDGSIKVETAYNREYEVMLHVNGDVVSRTVAFRKVPDGYVWIHEQEIHHGPKKPGTDDSEGYEFIVIQYQTQPVCAIPVNTLHIRYHGANEQLAHREDLTRKEIKTTLDDWSKAKSR